MTQRAAVEGEVLFPGRAEGRLLRLTAPLSFWGGIDPLTGCIILASHPERTACVAGRVLALAEPIGSSSSSVLLELIHNGKAPAALLLGRPDAILIVGCLVARELGMAAPPVVAMEPAVLQRLPEGVLEVADGRVALANARPSS